ncbi:Tub family protein [Trichuris trichiura]|uniref:Tub family protein n=1 Tax=Trichuris trichiura TaxID=36087 RepID=A0A077ZD09_TRITR|nr:Tub family protein [Trichuris trichiura]
MKLYKRSTNELSEKVENVFFVFLWNTFILQSAMLVSSPKSTTTELDRCYIIVPCRQLGWPRCLSCMHRFYWLELIRTLLQCLYPKEHSLLQFVCRPATRRFYGTMVPFGPMRLPTGWELLMEHAGGQIPLLRAYRLGRFCPEYLIWLTGTHKKDMILWRLSITILLSDYSMRRTYLSHLLFTVVLLLQIQKVALLSANFWCTQFSVKGLQPSALPKRLADINYSPNIFHAQPRQLTVKLVSPDCSAQQADHKSYIDSEAKTCLGMLLSGALWWEKQLADIAYIDEDDEANSNLPLELKSSDAVAQSSERPVSCSHATNREFSGDSNRPRAITRYLLQTERLLNEYDMESGNVLVLNNTHPLWNRELEVFQLDFGGRVTLQSAKNFQINYNDKQVLQFGRISGSSYVLDFEAPFSPVQAFALALTSFMQRLL